MDGSVPPASPTLPPGLDGLARDALDRVADMVVITDRDGTIVYVNEAFSRVTGYPADEVVGGNPRVLRSGLQDDSFYADLWDTLLSGRAWHGEIVNRRRDGTLYPDDMRISPLLDGSGQPAYFVAVKRDISRTLSTLTSASPTAIAHVRPDGALLYANEQLELLLGRSYEALAGEGWLEPFPEPEAERLRELIAEALDQPEASRRFAPGDGRHLRARCSPLRGDRGVALGAVLVLEDITDLVTETAAAMAREAMISTVLDGLPDPVLLIDGTGSVVLGNAAWRRWRHDGDAGGQAEDARLLELDHELGAEVARIRSGERTETTLERADEDAAGRLRWWLLRIRRLEREHGAIVTWTDITERKQEELRASHRASHDLLTGLPNRAGGMEVLERALQAGPLALLLIDLDRFKAVNDTYGHAAGDELLVVLARRLARASRTTDTVARLGGDEFLVVAPGLTSTAEAEELVSRLTAVVARPVRLSVGLVDVGASIGYALAGTRAEVDDLLSRADAAMYAVKRRAASDRRSDDTPEAAVGTPPRSRP